MKILRFLGAHRQFTLFLALALLIVGVAVFAPAIAPHDPLEAHMDQSLQAPDSTYLCGTDKLGRDVLSRVIYGTRASLTAALTLVAVIFVIGTVLGVVAGYFGGVVDAVIMRLADMMISFPGLVLAIAIAGMLGPNLVNAVIAISAVSWTKYARLARSLVLKIRSSVYIEAAVVTGTKTGVILRRYVLPNMVTTMIVTAVTDLGAMMLELAGLSFLGFGATAPTPEWGLMLSEGRTYLATAPWLMIWPGLAIVITVAVFNLLGDSIRDILDPKEASGHAKKKGKRLWEKQKGVYRHENMDEKTALSGAVLCDGADRAHRVRR